jgi:hypothetical protein
MEYIMKFLNWVKTKPTWAKAIISIIALLVTIILTFTSCSASYMLHKKGVHTDSVELWIKTKTNNAVY